MLLAILVDRYRFIDHARYDLKVKNPLTLKPKGFTMALARRSPADRPRNRVRSAV